MKSAGAGVMGVSDLPPKSFSGVLVALLAASIGLSPALAMQDNFQSRLIPSGETSALPRVRANDNRKPAGRIDAEGTLNVDLEVRMADFRIETPERPGLRLAAIGEVGEAPSIPAPLFRMVEGTRIRVSVHNSLSDSTLTVFGFQERPAPSPDSLVIEPGKTVTYEFFAGAEGTYMYWMRLGAGLKPAQGEREQLAGAFVVDAPGEIPDDRVFVINVFSAPEDSSIAPSGFDEALTINGKSWPFTERQRPQVGDRQRWRFVNASARNHPMHLHGFFYDITALGNAFTNERFASQDREKVVTHFMRGKTTMDLEWVPSRPGNWLFHCHLSFHVTNEIRLPGAPELDTPDEHIHMAGLVLGIEVQPGASDLIHHGEDRRLTLYANEYPASDRTRYAFSFEEGEQPDSTTRHTPGPPLILRQYQATYVTVQNNLSVPTGIHWHGLEIDGWADGVPGWSASDGKVSPVIQPGESFTYKLSSMRPGTFIYHSHMNDIPQLTGGLYGAIIVRPENEDYDTEFSHLEIVGWRDPSPQSLDDAELNGLGEQPDVHIRVGESHRLRLINIAPAGNVFLSMKKGDEVYPVLAVAKDGADFPENQRTIVEKSERFGVGETADFVFSPTEPGDYELIIGYGGPAVWTQKWIVHK